MADNLSPVQRKLSMSRVKGTNTKPEIIVRRILHKLGFRFRLHNRNLPGKPDIVLPRHKKIIFVHGCFWHGHSCSRGKRPSTREEFWNNKLDLNLKRDIENQVSLEALGWKILVIWQCELKSIENLTNKINSFMFS